jgi:redox-sensitive bicupin YhaK (pirin superfamily)
VAFRTRGQRHGPITRLMSPSDLGELLRPFVFLITSTPAAPQVPLGLAPHSGIATVTWIMEGDVFYEDTTGETGKIPRADWSGCRPGAVSGTAAGLAIRHVSAAFSSGWRCPRARAGPAHSLYLKPDQIQRDGPAAVLLGRYGTATSPIRAPSPINYLSMSLKAGERWTYQPSHLHTGLGRSQSWRSAFTGSAASRELAVFEESNEPIDFDAETDVEFVVGSAVKHSHDLVLGNYSVHTSVAALREGEARIQQIGNRLRAVSRLT